jgi:N-acetylglutamate synthase-like GNAT family acetyltransferase
MTTRILPRDEYPRLAHTEAASVWPQLTEAACVIVVEHDGAIVGCHVLQPVLHAECLWIDPAHRGKASVARRLWATVQRAARERFGVAWFATAAVSDDVRRLLAHVGAVRVDADHYMVPVRGQ